MNTFGTLSPADIATPQDIARFAVEAATCAPSVHNTQPWWFSESDTELGIHADSERRLRIADPDGREMLISCGAATLTARVALRYLGLIPRVLALPDQDLPSLVARITWSGKTAATDYEQELFAQIPRRRSHRGGFDHESLLADVLAAFGQEAAKEQASLRILGDESQRACLSAVVEAGDRALRLDDARAREQAKWAPPPGSKRRDGVPSTAYPARPEQTEPRFPARDFARGHGWGLPPAGQGHLPRSAGVVALLTTAADQREDWVSAGQALQRVLLCASASGVACALHSQPLEIQQLRDFIRIQLCDGAYPQMILRLGTTSQAAVSVRRRIDDVLF